jgi:hypothetical protein
MTSEASREGTRAVFEMTISRLAGEETAAAAEVAKALESAVRLAATGRSRAVDAGKYARTASAVNATLAAQDGAFPDDVCGIAALAGRMTAQAVVALALGGGPPEPTAREVMVRAFVRALVRADPHWASAGARDETLALARAIESACYNATIRQSKAEEDPPRRQWDAPEFVDIYSGRCGVILSHLDPDSTSCRAYGALVAPRLLDASLTPEALGGMCERDLCPPATAAERAEIACRGAQRVEEKESNLFRCPHCRERRCTYREVQRRGLDEAPDYRCVCLNPVCRRRFAGRQD